MSLSWDIQTFDTLPSTQDLCKARAGEAAPEGLVIQAIAQSDGRGRHGRSWDAGEGNLTLSFILRPECEAQYVGQISILIGLSLAQAIEVFDLKDVQLKWPNDVLYKTKKCAGILIDSALKGQSIEWLVIGVGVNTQSSPEIGNALGLDRDEFRDVFLEQVALLYTQWQAEGFEHIRDQWLKKTFAKGTPLNVGVFEDLDEWGNLVVRNAQNTLKTISAGDVFIKDWA